MNDAQMQHDFSGSTHIYFEHSVAWNGNAYMVIFGHHVNGGFIAIPNWGICCEASDIYPTSFYNKERLIASGLSEDTAEALALYIDDVYEEIVHNTMDSPKEATPQIFKTGSVSVSQDLDDVISTAVQIGNLESDVGQIFGDDFTFSEDRYTGLYGCQDILRRIAEGNGLDPEQVDLYIAAMADGRMSAEMFKDWLLGESEAAVESENNME